MTRITETEISDRVEQLLKDLDKDTFLSIANDLLGETFTEDDVEWITY